ncbi:hypothetical protein [Cryptosporangium sp. NPDC051539]|uniref:hypothetical protein n=1 Tax=Cryptosporangium sp. NPDC051539 TaxID=3363962 RepID=UPI0037AE3144
MSVEEAALWAARARAEGPLSVPPGAPAPDGFVRLVEPGVTRAWWVPVGPDAVTPAALRDLRLTVPTLTHPNEAARVLAGCLRCCWTDLGSAPWPGRAATVEAVLTVLTELLPTRSPEMHQRFAAEALRQLADAGWLHWHEPTGVVRLGPRVVMWPASDVEALRELCRTMPQAPESQAAEPQAPEPREAADPAGADA